MFDSVDIANINCAVKRVGEKAANRSWNLIKKELAELPKTPTNKQSDVIPLWRVRDVLQGHFDYKTVNIVMDDME